MATIQIQIPDTKVQTILDAFGYQTTLIDGTANPETPNSFMKRTLIQFVKNRVEAKAKETAFDNTTPIDINIT